MSEIAQKSLFLTDGEHQLHLRHIHQPDGPQGTPILMVHGAIENGKIFYNEKGRGLGCFLAKHGFDVYVLDLRGRGETIPPMKPNDDYGQTETIVNDLPLFINEVHKRNPQPLHIITHSWGGVLVASTLARFPDLIDKIKSTVNFGTKRQVSAMNWEVLVKIRFMWHWYAKKLTKKHGFLPARRMSFGSDDETIKSHHQSMQWTKTHIDWVDDQDQFDYRKASKTTKWPSTWFIAAKKDKALGHPKDVKRFIKEANFHHAKYTLLSKANGYAKDYDHINMLTDPGAVDDHFVEVLEWLES